MQALINSLTERELNIIASMVDLDCVDWTPTIEQLVDAIQMFGYSEQDILDRLNSINEFVFEDDFECNCNQHEIDMFFESDEMFEDYTQEDSDYAQREMQDELISPCSYLNQFYSSTIQLYSDLLIHSVDTRVGF